jgi:hypothetical protein
MEAHSAAVNRVSLTAGLRARADTATAPAPSTGSQRGEGRRGEGGCAGCTRRSPGSTRRPGSRRCGSGSCRPPPGDLLLGELPQLAALDELEREALSVPLEKAHGRRRSLTTSQSLEQTTQTWSTWASAGRPARAQTSSTSSAMRRSARSESPSETAACRSPRRPRACSSAVTPRPRGRELHRVQGRRLRIVTVAHAAIPSPVPGAFAGGGVPPASRRSLARGRRGRPRRPSSRSSTPISQASVTSSSCRSALAAPRRRRRRRRSPGARRLAVLRCRP